MSEESRAVESGDLEGLSSKLDDFAKTLEPAEQMLLTAMISSAGGVDESEVEGFSMGSFKMASMLALDPLRGGMVGRAKDDPPTWMEWTQSRDIPLTIPKG